MAATIDRHVGQGCYNCIRGSAPRFTEVCVECIEGIGTGGKSR